MANNPADESLATLAAPLGELIAAVGRGLADAQKALDHGTIETLKALYSGKDADMNMLRQIGYQPTWYRIPELDAEITASLSVSRSSKGTGSTPGALRMYMSPVDATYSNSYDYNLQAASVIKFKVVAVPPSSQAADMKVVPALVDKPLENAKQLLVDMGMPFETTGTGTTVIETSPKPGELLSPGAKVILSLGS
jgi:hypothetical protein